MLLLDPNVILRSEPQYYQTYVAFDHKNIKTEYLTKDEFHVLEIISNQSVNTKEVAKTTRMTSETLTVFLKHMKSSGFVKEVHEEIEVKRPDKVKIDQKRYEEFPVPFLSAPTSVDIFITGRCNLKCIHCFSNREDEILHELSFEQLESIFDQLEKMRVLEVRINGGEPFLHTDIDKILSSLERRKFRRVILTNGTMLNNKNVKLLKESNTIPTISLDDSNPDGHDSFRGVKGSFNRTIKALKLLQKHNVQYGINTSLHRKNLNRYEDIIKLAIKHGAYRIAFLDMKLWGRMKRNKEWLPTYDEYEKMIISLTIAKLKYKRKIDVSLDVFLFCRPLEESIQEAKKGYVSCQAGRNRLSIDSEGSVYPCNLVLSDPYWRIGNIKNEKIIDLWFSEKWLPFRGGVKIDDLEKCKNCKQLSDCTDFYCRLLPYMITGDPFGPHPRCS